MKWPGQDGEFHFGEPGKPLPDWRKDAAKQAADGREPLDDDPPTPEEKAANKAILGFDSAELEA